jgi:hypothetical protein
MLLRILFFLCFASSAHAGFVLEEQERDEADIGCPNPHTRFTLTTDKSVFSPRLKIQTEEPKTKEFIDEVNKLTFEEHCILVSASPDCTTAPKEVIQSLNIVAIKSNSDLYFCNEKSLQVNNGTFSANEDITFRSNHVKVNALFKTHRSVIIESYTPQSTINRFIFTPHLFNFLSESGMQLPSYLSNSVGMEPPSSSFYSSYHAGMELPSSSFYASININFLTNYYHIIWQSASLRILGGLAPDQNLGEDLHMPQPITWPSASLRSIFEGQLKPASNQSLGEDVNTLEALD